MSNTQPKYDSLEYASELKEAGFTDNQAKVQAKALFRVIDQQLVTKQDIKELEGKLTFDMKELEGKLSHDIKELEGRLSHDIKELEGRLSHDMKELETKLSYDIKELELKTAHQMKELESQLVFRLTKIMVILLGLSISIVGLMIKFF